MPLYAGHNLGTKYPIWSKLQKEIYPGHTLEGWQIRQIRSRIIPPIYTKYPGTYLTPDDGEPLVLAARLLVRLLCHGGLDVGLELLPHLADLALVPRPRHPRGGLGTGAAKQPLAEGGTRAPATEKMGICSDAKCDDCTCSDRSPLPHRRNWHYWTLTLPGF